MPSPESTVAARAAGSDRPAKGSGGAVYALVGRCDSPGALLHACEALREEGYTRFDAHTPFPVHGLERAMGLRRSLVPWIVLGMGILGGVGAFALQMWTMGVDYPQNISGKPLFAYQAYVPVTFEATVLFAAFGAFFGMWGLNRLPMFYHPVMRHTGFDRASDDGFFVSVDASDPEFDLARTRALLKELGVRELQEVES